mmetsp:Transcript_19550/g.34694  ORF Transcript_19550/g.34694 Transcript_19550/m.34694 type:complete len:402 (+) Transcript_19550:78-1283(+)
MAMNASSAVGSSKREAAAAGAEPAGACWASSSTYSPQTAKWVSWRLMKAAREPRCGYTESHCTSSARESKLTSQVLLLRMNRRMACRACTSDPDAPDDGCFRACPQLRPGNWVWGRLETSSSTAIGGGSGGPLGFMVTHPLVRSNHCWCPLTNSGSIPSPGNASSQLSSCRKSQTWIWLPRHADRLRTIACRARTTSGDWVPPEGPWPLGRRDTCPSRSSSSIVGASRGGVLVCSPGRVAPGSLPAKRSPSPLAAPCRRASRLEKVLLDARSAVPAASPGRRPGTVCLRTMTPLDTLNQSECRSQKCTSRPDWGNVVSQFTICASFEHTTRPPLAVSASERTTRASWSSAVPSTAVRAAPCRTPRLCRCRSKRSAWCFTKSRSLPRLRNFVSQASSRTMAP